MANKRIMVVEDEGITAINIKKTLEDIGYTVTSIAVSGKEAVKNAAEERPDLVLMDIVLEGEIDGIEAAELIRSMSDIPIIYLTAHSDESMVKRIKKTEPIGYIVKPFERKELRMALEIAFYKHKMESRLKESEKKFRVVVEGTGDLVTIMDGTGNFIYVNHVAENILGSTSDKCLGMSAFQFVHPDDRRLTMDWFGSCVEKRLEQASLENRLVNQKDGTLHHMLWTSNFFYDKNGNLITVNGIARDISGRKKYEEYLKTAVITDDLTKLLNRRGLFTLAGQQLKMVKRTKRQVALLYLDIDGFKNINDKLGHKEGDRALIDAANILRDTFRESDIVARIGGDEFAVLLTEPSGPNVENIIVTHLKNKLREFNAHGGREYDLSFSIGMASYDHEHSCSLDELLTRADKLMYIDKKGKLSKDITAALKAGEERRGFKRYSPVKGVRVEIDGSIRAEMKDISYGGTCLKSPQFMDADSIHEIKMLTPDETELSLKGLVVWMPPKEKSAQLGNNELFYDMGLKFIDMKQKEKLSLKKLITEITV